MTTPTVVASVYWNERRARVRSWDRRRDGRDPCDGPGMFHTAAHGPLSDAAVAAVRDRRGAGDDGPREARALWRGLTAGEWSIVDVFDREGRRFVVARRNAPSEWSSHRLSASERQVVEAAARGHANKRIALDRGISESTVSRRLSRAGAKLGVPSRVELVAALARLTEVDVDEADETDEGAP